MRRSANGVGGPGLAALLAAAAWWAGTSPAAAAESIKRALTDGEVDVDLRYRYERVDADGFGEDAAASTARLRLGYETGPYHGFWSYLDLEVLRSLGGETYNSTANGRTRYPVVADPEDEEVNQAFLGFRAPMKSTVKLGRQRIKLGNDRFVGNVGWRQLEQTFDALTVSSEPGERVSWFVGYLNNANRVFGEHNPSPVTSPFRADLDLDGRLAHVDVATGAGMVSAYLHFLELQDLPAASHRNIGARLAGRRAMTDRTDLLYTVEYADQSDHEDAPSTVDAEYHWIELGADFDPWVVKVGLEVLGGDGVYGFQTPLATGHRFNGWADRFLTTPAGGLEDLYVSASRKVGRYELTGVYHGFDADAGGADYGSEIDLLASRDVNNVTCTLKFAKYDAGFPATGPSPPGFAFDTSILWLMVRYRPTD